MHSGRARQYHNGFAFAIGVLMLRFVAASFLMIGLCVLLAVAQQAPPKTGGDALPDGPGKGVVQRNCLSCHSVRIAISKRGNEDDWAATVSQMIGRGANISDDDADTIVEYMAVHFGPENNNTAHNTEPKPIPAEPAHDSGEAHPTAPTSVNVNNADVKELQTSLGLSKSEADAIVRYREQNGTFKDWEQVANVPGVDARKIKDHQKIIVF
jgi:competence ComEA-like helix-hairpin-helix protein